MRSNCQLMAQQLCLSLERTGVQQAVRLARRTVIEAATRTAVIPRSIQAALGSRTNDGIHEIRVLICFDPCFKTGGAS